MGKQRRPGGGRKKAKPTYSAEKNLVQQMEAAVSLYKDNMTLQAIADTLALNLIKVRKLLITAGVYESDTAKLVQQIFNDFRRTQSYSAAVTSTMSALQLSRPSVTSYASRFARGEYNLGNNRILGYDCVDGELVPNKDAWIVKEVFRRFIEGESYRQIAKELGELGAQSLHSKKRFGVETLRYMVSNETYVGDKRLQKKAPLDYLTKKPDPNQKVESNYLWDDHEAIIDRETWDKAQKILEKRKELAQVGIHKTNREHHFLYGKVFCGECGAPFLRRTLKAAGGSKTQSTYKAWNCRNRQKGKGKERCGNRFVKEKELIEAILQELEWPTMDQDRFEKEVSKVLVYPDHIEVEKN